MVERRMVLPVAVDHPRLVVLMVEVRRLELTCRILVVKVHPDRVE